MSLSVLDAINAVKAKGLAKLRPDRPRIAVGLGTCGAGNAAHEVLHALSEELSNKGVEARVTTVGCFGSCAEEPLVNVTVPDKPMLILNKVRPQDAGEIVEALAYGKLPVRRALCKIESWDHITSVLDYGQGLEDVPHWHQIQFFNGQKKIVLRNCGLINPEDIEEYMAVGGYATYYHVLKNMTPEQVIEQIKLAKLRGRGGAGFPTGNKWEILRNAKGDQKYIICNADEGDPGAYMNRNEIESDPHSLLEGMMIGAHAMGATEGVIYIRAEYPLAVLRLRRALDEARSYGLLGSEILGTSARLNIHLVEGAGAFVCGEETALIASLEGRAGRPRPRPPFPAQKGLWGKPTSINNVETWYNVVPIVAKGAEWFTQTGTKTCTGTKVFSLVGKVKNTGLVEMPQGTPLKRIIYDIGGGTGSSKKVKAVQTGGPSGGCIPAELFDAAVDYESLAAVGAIMGSGGMVVMDEDNCMVDVARFFVEFTHSESCGKCVPCRVGLDHALRLLRLVTEGTATLDDLAMLEELAGFIKDTALCGLGQTAPNPVLTTLKYFREEYLEHIQQQRCVATVCEQLFVSPCENSCPIHMNIPGYLALVQAGRMDDAATLIFLDNPLPASTGRVCQHPCESRCRRREIDEPVAIRDMHRHVVDTVLAHTGPEVLARRLSAGRFPDTGRSIAIVGAGPSGLTAAFYLTLLGHKVKVYERQAAAGGMLRYALPEYRLPKSAVDREIALIRDLGVDFAFHQSLGEGLLLAELTSVHDAVVLAIGTWKEVALGIPGSDLPGVISAVHFLEDVALHQRADIGRKVIVIGGGNSAIDSARTAVRLGAEVTVVYRRGRSDMPAIVEEREAAEAEGVKFLFLAVPRKIIGSEGGAIRKLEVNLARLGEFDTFGRRIPEATGEMASLDCDTIIVAAGEKVDGDLVRRLSLQLGRNDRVAVDHVTLACNLDKVYAVGDVVSGPANVATAMGYGKQAAAMIDKQLTGRDRMSQLRRQFDYPAVVPAEPLGGPRHLMQHLPASERDGNFSEVTMGLSAAEALAESSRCLRCDVKASPEAPVPLTVSAQNPQEVHR
jgi:NADH-quinone oxidoreductase subunit F